jgi:hypothetical protein
MLLRYALSLFAILVSLAAPALAQEEGIDTFVMPAFKGVAVAQSAEAGLGVCFSPDAADGIECAQAECMRQSGLGIEECAANLWCYPHGWVADIFMQHNEGPHWHKFVCDQQDRVTLEALIASECSREYLMECSAVRMWDPEGAEVLGIVTE